MIIEGRHVWDFLPQPRTCAKKAAVVDVVDQTLSFETFFCDAQQWEIQSAGDMPSSDSESTVGNKAGRHTHHYFGFGWRGWWSIECRG